MKIKFLCIFTALSVYHINLLSASAPTDTDPLGNGTKFDAIVSADGSGSYPTLQAAIDAAPDNGATDFSIFIKAGTYTGPFKVDKTKTHIHLVGGKADTTILTFAFNVNEGQPGAYQFNPGLVVLGDNFTAENITIENSSGDHGQALAMYTVSDKNVFKYCRLLGWQDTLLVGKGRNYYTDCCIEGRVDFIYGGGTAVFDHCEIHSKNGGYVTAANTPQEQPYGFVFLNCKLTGDSTPWVDPTKPAPTGSGRKAQALLARPWGAYSSVTFINCEMGDHIKPEGWSDWGHESNHLTSRYAEYKSTGPGANPDARVKWSKQLTDEEAAAFTIPNILGGSDNWNPSENKPQ